MGVKQNRQKRKAFVVNEEKSSFAQNAYDYNCLILYFEAATLFTTVMLYECYMGATFINNIIVIKLLLNNY